MLYEEPLFSITINGVDKKYKLYSTPNDRIKEIFHPFSKRYHREFLALENISFQIPIGQTVGILGRNGSGKSTLLQILAGVMSASKGVVQTNGKISALLELGAGFNPEFTGRQNAIFQLELSGIYGHNLLSTIQKIEEFAGIGEFFDQPVKLYSSGMFVRLAFSVAINVKPDILIIDEALSVGDAEFQQKCYLKFKEFQNSKTTIIFVTHDIQSILKHCQRAILLDKGNLIIDADPKTVTTQYINLIENKYIKQLKIEALNTEINYDSMNLENQIETIYQDKNSKDLCFTRKFYNRDEYHQYSEDATIIDYLLKVNNDSNFLQALSGNTLNISFKVIFYKEIKKPCFGISLKTKDGITIYALNSSWIKNKEFHHVTPGNFVIASFNVPLGINSGDLFIDFGVDQEDVNGGFINLTRRLALVHLYVQAENYFEGYANLDCTFESTLLN